MLKQKPKSKITQDVFISDNRSQHGDATYNVNIYITSDEEIKEGDWLIWNDKVYKDSKRSFTGVDYSQCKKIILTTDQDLINDGVQKINDEFLQWFIKNPRCEWVEIRKEMYMPQSNGKISDGKITHEISLDPSQNTLPYYKIIIPKEEPKQIKCYCGHTTYCDCIPLEELKQGRMYSEEEVLELLEDFEKERSTKVIFAKQWFNKFKKK